VLSDGKAGHRNQSLALAEALQRQRPELQIHEIAAASPLRALLDVVRGTSLPAPPPCLLIGAGHATHASLLLWRQRAACPAVVLMRPSLPRGLFDLCIEPRHDGGVERDDCWLSDGPLTRLRPGESREEPGLILIGGPSPHYRWDSRAVLTQLAHICDGTGSWLLSTSRRTPADFIAALQGLELPGLSAQTAEQLGADWLARELPRTRHCWVTPDSASMVYEALSAGCAVGLFELEALRGSRVAEGMRSLQSRALCTGFSAWDHGAPLQAPPVPLAEADRIAARLLERGLL
jgi:mitochondrial fission protein ELM1